MGNSSYSSSNRTIRSSALGYTTKSRQELFSNTTTAQHMKPQEITMREARDSDTHPCSIPVMLCLDVTGSMGDTPHQLVRDGLPKMVSKTMAAGIDDAAIMMVAIGDHRSDTAPLQMGQFESGDEELDNDLTNLYLEGNGGGNGGESYLLAWIAAAHKTVTDHWDKRGKKGILITVGDEKCHQEISKSSLEYLFGTGEWHDFSAAEALTLAREKWQVFHIHVKGTPVPDQPGREDEWTERLGENFYIAENYVRVPDVLANIIAKHGHGSNATDGVVTPGTTTQEPPKVTL